MIQVTKHHVFSFIWNLTLLSVAIFLTYFGAPLVYKSVFCEYLGSCGGGFFGFDLSGVVWVVGLYTFSATAILSALGTRSRYWWVAIANMPVLLLILRLTYQDFNLFEFSNPAVFSDFVGALYILGAWGIYIFAGWILGWLIRKLVRKFAPGMMARI